MTRELIPPGEGGSYVFDPVTGALDLVERGGAEATAAPSGAVAVSEPALPEPDPAAAPAATAEADPAGAAETGSAPAKKTRKD